MSGRLFTPADIFRAKALACEPEQLLPQGCQCEDCEGYQACQYLTDEPLADRKHCRYNPPEFRSIWRPRAA